MQSFARDARRYTRIQREAGITTIFVTQIRKKPAACRQVVFFVKACQQRCHARELYEPANLFAADFLGTPPINKPAQLCARSRFAGRSDISLPVSLKNLLQRRHSRCSGCAGRKRPPGKAG